MPDHIFSTAVINHAQRQLDRYKEHVDQYGKHEAQYYLGRLSGMHASLIVLNQAGDLAKADKELQRLVDEAIAYVPKQK